MDTTTGTVAEYYDKNTGAFLRFGQGGRLSAIHRAVRGPGVETRDQAFQFVEKLITDYIGRMHFRAVVDLGCGCGASMAYIGEHAPGVRVYGITISGVQYRIGKELLLERGLAGNIRQGNYLDPEFYSSLGLPGAPGRKPYLFYAIESFLHSPDGGRFFSRLRQFTLPGDRLIICDDFVAGKPDTGRLRRLSRDFRLGWHASNLLTTDELEDLSRRHGFAVTDNRDLTEMLELNRFRDIMIRLIVPFLRMVGKRSFTDNLVGGNALQVLLLRGVLRYRFLILERRS